MRGESLKEAIAQFHGEPGRVSAGSVGESVGEPGRVSAGSRTPGESDGEPGRVSAGSRSTRRTRGAHASALALRRLLSRFLDVCNAIAYAHGRGVLHRDIKPGNILLGPYGETLVVDWGLAKIVGRDEPGTIEPSAEPTRRPPSASGTGETVPRTALGTPAYMSPEPAEGRVNLLGPALAYLTNEIGDRQDALRSYEESLAIFGRLAREHPNVNAFQSNLAKDQTNIGLLESRTASRWRSSSAWRAGIPSRPTTRVINAARSLGDVDLARAAQRELDDLVASDRANELAVWTKMLGSANAEQRQAIAGTSDNGKKTPTSRASAMRPRWINCPRPNARHGSRSGPRLLRSWPKHARLERQPIRPSASRVGRARQRSPPGCTSHPAQAFGRRTSLTRSQRRRRQI